MNEPYADKWQQYFAPQVAARNRWATPGFREPVGRRRSLPRRLAPVVALATGLGVGVFALTPAAHASTDVASVTFWPTGGEQLFAVPLGVTSVHVATVGGHGGASRVFDDSFDGGAGATASADLDVTGGETLYLEVGGNGTEPTYANTSDTTYVYTPGHGGFNGGGDAGLRVGGGGGGGASDVRAEPAAAAGSLDSRLVVAGGGGGAGMAGIGGSSGLTGAPGTWPGGHCVDPGGPGAGATADAGGAGGSAPYGGAAGLLGSGGDGGGVDIFEALGGGGGGGGYYGGGGGGGGVHVCGGSGGGGSSFAASAARSPSFGTDTTGAPRITISYLVPQAPQPLTTAASDVGPTGATLNGVVNPEGADTTYHFEYWPTIAGDKVLTADAGPLTGTAEQRVSAALTGLAPGTDYHFRLVATNANGTTADPGDLSFTTASAPTLSAPTAVTGPAGRISGNRALLHGTVNPCGSATSYYFEYGTTSGYGSTTPHRAAGSGSANRSVTAWTNGLRRHTTYHVRVVAVNAQGTTYGTDRTFRTR